MIGLHRAPFFLFCFSLFFALSFSQDFKVKTDSLKRVLSNANGNEEKIKASIELGKIYNRSHIDSAIIYFKKAILLSEQSNQVNLKASAYSSIATSYIIKGKFDSAHYYFNKAEIFIPKVADYKITTSFYGDKGILQYYQGDIEKASNSFKNALNIAKANNAIPSIIKYSNNTALAYTKLGKNNDAIDIYFETLKLAESENDIDQVGKLLNNIGLIYENMNQYEKALEFYERAFQSKKGRATQIDMANAHYNMANMQLKLAGIKEDSMLVVAAFKNFNKTLEISQDNEYGNGKLYGYEGLGQMAINNLEYNKARTIYSSMERQAVSSSNDPFIALSNLKLGGIALREGSLIEAERRLLKAKAIIEKTDVLKDKSELYTVLTKLYAENGDYKKAYGFLKLQNDIGSQLSSQNLQDKISNYEVKYLTEKKEKEIVTQRAEIAQKELRLSKKNMQLTGLGVMALLLAVLGYLVYNQQRLKNQQLQKEGELKEALARIETQNRLQKQRLRISRDLHDNIGAQLTFIISSVENLRYALSGKNEKLTNRLSYIGAFAKDTIYELRDTIWAMNKTQISLEDLEARISNFVEKANDVSKNITFKFNIGKEIATDIKFTSIKGMNVYRIVQEAIHNALKYAEANTIEVNVSQEEDMLLLKISDDGRGFDMNMEREGNGLNNMRKRAEEIGAEINIESAPNSGTSVFLSTLATNE